MNDTYIKDSIKLLREIVGIPSFSFEETEVCSHICRFLHDCGIGIYREGNNIIALNRSFRQELKTLMLNAHIDTVQPCTGYSFDPFNPDYDAAANVIKPGGTRTRANGGYEFICGLGTNDDGASVVSMISAFRHFYNTTLPINLILVLSCEEERSGKGGMEHLWADFPEIIYKANGEKHRANDFRHPDWAIIGEPTGMKAATSERGLLVIDGTAHGVSGHAARNEGENALYIAIEDIERLRAHKFSKKSDIMGDITLNVTQIHAGTSHNVIPDRCEFTVDIRPNDVYSNKEIMEELQRICRSTLNARNLNNRSSATPKGSILMQCIKAARIGTFASPTTSDWMRTGCEAIKMGPGDSSRSHRKDEFVYVSEIEDAVETYVRFIGEFCRIFTNIEGQK